MTVPQMEGAEEAQEAPVEGLGRPRTGVRGWTQGVLMAMASRLLKNHFQLGDIPCVGPYTTSCSAKVYFGQAADDFLSGLLVPEIRPSGLQFYFKSRGNAVVL